MKRRRQSYRHRPSGRPSAKDYYLANVSRKPCRWDILGYELSQALTERCRQVCPGLMTKALRFGDQEQPLIGVMLARGFEVLVAENWPAGDGEGWLSLWPVDEANVQAASVRAGRCFEGLLRKYVWDKQQVYLPRPARDLDRLVQALTGTLREFLLKRCAPGKDLEGCLLEPLGSDKGFFPVVPAPPVEGRPSGDPARDVRQLALLVREADDAGTLKQKLVQFVHTDPWLSIELIGRLLDEAADREEAKTAEGEHVPEKVTDDFLFDASSLWGLSPIQLFLQRQPDMPARQRQRLQRWDREAFLGAFAIEAVEGSFLRVEDLTTGRRLRVTATIPAAFRQVHPQSILATRLVPWDDYCLVSGAQQLFDRVGQKAIEDMRKKAHMQQSLWRPPQLEGEAQAKAWQLQAEHYDAWMQLFGTDTLHFETGKQLQEALHRFEAYWTHTHVSKDLGMTPAEKYRQEHGREMPSKPRMRLPEDLLNARDISLLNDPRHGMEFLGGYAVFSSAFESSGPLTVPQVEAVWEYLRDESIPYHVFQKMKERYPQRTAEVLRVVLRDEEFDLERDFDKVLGMFKGRQMRYGPAPSISVVDPAGL